jgi:hypothetical protein
MGIKPPGGLTWTYRWHYVHEGNAGFTRGISFWPRNWLELGRARGTFDTNEHIFVNIGRLQVSWGIKQK